MLNHFYRDELNFLKQQGRDFAKANPGLSRFLSERSSDPDVERLLEGFAFLTGRVREKVEDEFPELVHSLITMLWPNYLRTVPSMTIVQFTPVSDAVSQSHSIKRGASIASIPVEDRPCLFRTCRDVTLYPLAHGGISARHTREASIVELTLDVQSDQPLNELGIGALRLYLGGDGYTARTLYLWLSHYLLSLDVEVAGSSYSLPIESLQAVGFEKGEGLLPYPPNAQQGYRILQEYLCFPEAFHFFDVENLGDALPSKTASSITLRFTFKRPLPTDARICAEHMSLYCTPVINLFEHDAEPIALTGERNEYRIRPRTRSPSHFEIFSVDSVQGTIEPNDDEMRARYFHPFESFQHQIERDKGHEKLYYRIKIAESLRYEGFDHSIAFVRSDDTKRLGQSETISLDLTCSNRALPEQLHVGDVCVPTEKSPSFATFTNITPVTRVLRPAVDDRLLWVLISNLSLNYLSLLNRDALCAILKVYDFKSLIDKQAERVAQKRLSGIVSIETKAADRLYKGLPVRGLRSIVTLDQEAFGDEGALYIFGSVLARFLSLYANINSFHELQVINVNNNEHYLWAPQAGQQSLM